jgi:hypothetical protein
MSTRGLARDGKPPSPRKEKKKVIKNKMTPQVDVNADPVWAMAQNQEKPQVPCDVRAG